MAETIRSHSPIVTFPAERVAGDVANIAEAVRAYCLEQHYALSPDHHVALEGLIDAINGLGEELDRFLLTLP